MQIIHGSKLEINRIEQSVVTIGNFDGVHRGHGELFRCLNEQAKNLGVPSVVVTFEPHPLHVLCPSKAPVLIATLQQKLSLIEEFGVDVVVVIPFTREFSQVSPDDFVLNTLCASLGMRHLIIGHDYAFGKNREGNFQTLQRLSLSAGFTLQDLEPVGVGDIVFSSSEIRRAVSNGELELAACMLGRYHIISGIVVHGKHRGESLGFPTANLKTPHQLLPADGVYAVWVTIADRHFMGACNVGKNLTFGAHHRTIEVFLLDTSMSLYGLEIAIHFVRHLRPVQKFADSEALKTAIAEDVNKCRVILTSSDQSLIHPGSMVARQEYNVL